MKPVEASSGRDEERLYLKGRSVSAVGQRTPEGFVVFAGSGMMLEAVPSAGSSIVRLRNELIQTGVVEAGSNGHVFKQDYLFGSPSRAAVVILGRNTNGLTKWRNSQGVSLKELESDGIETKDSCAD